MKRKLIDEDEVIFLITDCKRGNQRALTKLYERVSPLLKHFAVGITHNEALGSEVLQDSFIQIWENVHSFDPSKGTPISWMRTIVRNKAIDKLRAESKHAKVYHGDNDDLMQEIPSSSAYQPDVALSKLEDGKLLNHHFEHLPPDQRMSLRLAYFHDYSRLELAAAMGTNINTIKSWLRRGLKTMKASKSKHNGYKKTQRCKPLVNI